MYCTCEWKVRGINDGVKGTFRRENIDMLGLYETKLRGNGTSECYWVNDTRSGLQDDTDGYGRVVRMFTFLGTQGRGRQPPEVNEAWPAGRKFFFFACIFFKRLLCTIMDIR